MNWQLSAKNGRPLMSLCSHSNGGFPPNFGHAYLKVMSGSVDAALSQSSALKAMLSKKFVSYRSTIVGRIDPAKDLSTRSPSLIQESVILKH
jgi:hypothetical protein